MNTTLRRSVAGPVRELGHGQWQLTLQGGGEVFIGGVEADAALALRGATAIGIEWRKEGVQVRLESPEGTRTLQGRVAIVHDPLPRLYESLPLASFDERARRFWRRVFLLVRLPGGRRLLGLIARRSGRPG
ncbi:MAG TPA: hypothetical protein VK437_06275 [Steroidobacteraceae bacterium]|nr:hypothetical protein [Steroidobacteraceae bacterium]